LAAPLAKIQMAAKVKGESAGYRTQVVSSAGDIIEFIVTVEMAPRGTSNSNGYTINSLTAGVDGCNSFAIDFAESSSAPVQVDLNSPVGFIDDWGAGTGVSGGTFTPRPGAPSRDDLLGSSGGSFERCLRVVGSGDFR
jgi:hypothetical protein